jgi:signal peptidase
MQGELMEIAPVPHRSPRGDRRRLAIGLLVLAPVVLLVLLPAVLGLDRYVITDRSMGGSLSRGAVALAREVPPEDLHAGDVITYAPPPSQSSQDRVTRRIVSIDDGVAVTRGDARDAVDPWRLELSEATYARVWLSVPWIGYPFVLDGGWVVLVLAAAIALGLAVAAGRSTPQKLPKKAARASRPRLPVA